MTVEQETTYLAELQAKWERLALLDPLWAVWTEPRFKGRRWKPEAFYRIGEREVAYLMTLLEKGGHQFPHGAALDFGCGVGRHTRPLARRFELVVGLDISATMLAFARSYTTETNIEYVLSPSSRLAACKTRSFNFVLSRNTLQHMAPGIIASYLSELVRVLSRSGLLVFQLPSTRKRDGTDSDEWAPLGKALDAEGYPRMDMYGMEQGKVVRILERAGGRVVVAWLDATAVGWDGYTYLVRRGDT